MDRQHPPYNNRASTMRNPHTHAHLQKQQQQQPRQHESSYDMKQAIGCLHPIKPTSAAKTGQERHRFSQLLLEHGERHLQDWAAVASSSPCGGGALHAGSSPTAASAGAGNAAGGTNGRRGRGARMDKLGPSHFQAQAAQRYGSSSHARHSPLALSNSSNTNMTAPASPSTTMGHIEGRLRLCSNSVVFEPDDWSRGIIRCPFARMDEAPISLAKASANFHSTDAAVHDHTHKNNGAEGDVVVFKCSRHSIMKTMNVIAPFESLELPTTFRFKFVHSSPNHFLDMAENLYQAQKSKSKTTPTTTTPTTTTPESMIAKILTRPFDTTNLIDIREQPLTTNLPCSLLTPLLSNPGCALATKSRLYFQPALGLFSSGAKATSWLYDDMVGYARRYSGLKDSALELFLREGTGGGFTSPTSYTHTTSTSSNTISILLAFETTEDRERMIRLLPRRDKRYHTPLPCHTDREFILRATYEWQRGQLDNFEYLLALNSAAGRTFHDLSRYPVFPWVVSDYSCQKLHLNFAAGGAGGAGGESCCFRDLTKPVGALDANRLEYFCTRLAGMQDSMEHPFLYGTHYSAPGYVLYYLVRSMPEHMLCLQNGKFDSPDRMFHSLEQCYSSVLTNHADVKELIPEFYDVNSNSGFDFLINARNLKLGMTQNGERVDDVLLPPWARSARDFVKKNRKALESEYCSEHLPRWIDLVFGWNSRGENARKEMNLFHQMAYLGPEDLLRMKSEEERAQAELQATEFGIVPDQLFQKKHPTKKEMVNLEELVCPDSGRGEVDWGAEDVDLVPEDRVGSRAALEEKKQQQALQGGDQPWELLDSPSKSMKSFEEEDAASLQTRDRGWSSDSFRDRMWSTESANDRGAGNNSHDGVQVARPTNNNNNNAPDNPATPRQKTGNHSSYPENTNRSNFSEREKDNKGKSKSSWLPTFSGNKQTQNENDHNGAERDRSGLGTTASSGSMSEQGDYGGRYLGGADSLVTHSTSSGGEVVDKSSYSSQTSMSQMLSQSHTGGQGRLHVNTGSSSRSRPQNVAEVGESPLGSPQQGWTLKHVASKNAHGDSVSSCAVMLEEVTQDGGSTHSLATVSLDGILKIHSLDFGTDNDRQKGSSSSSRSSTLRMLSRGMGRGATSSEESGSKLSTLRSHSAADPLACLAVAEGGNGGQIVFAGGHDDVILAYGVQSACALASLYSHRDAVTGLDMLRCGHRTAAAQTPPCTHLMVSGSWDATVKIWSVNISGGETVAIHREPLAELYDADASIVSVSAKEVMGYGVVLCAGCSDGSFVVWLFSDDGAARVIHKESAKRGFGRCAAVKWGPVTVNTGCTTGIAPNVLFVGFASGRIGSFILQEGKLTSLSEVSLGSPVRCIAVDKGILLAGCVDGALRAIPLQRDAFFDSSPRVWGGLMGKSSPALSCVSFKRIHGQGNRWMCAVGTDDGNVVVYELADTSFI